jgi:DNA-binding response OmpR family regulator
MKLRIVLVEDSSDDAFVLQRALNRSSFSLALEILLDGEQAMAYFSKLATSPARLPDLIILDINLPRLDGYEVLKGIKAHAGLNSIPILMHSGSTRLQDKQKALELGANGYLTKTHDGSEVVKTIQNLLTNTCLRDGSLKS